MAPSPWDQNGNQEQENRGNENRANDNRNNGWNPGGWNNGNWNSNGWNNGNWNNNGWNNGNWNNNGWNPGGWNNSGWNNGSWNNDNGSGNNSNFTAPRNPPPAQIPQRPNQAFGGAGARAVNPSSIRNCMGRFTYIWLSNGQEFWFFPLQIWGDSIAGFRWDRRFGWTYVGISLNRIDMFTCTI